jgi:soluble lytic murein transglycosylase-like protein
MRAVFAAISTFSLAGAAFAEANPCEREIAAAAHKYTIPLAVFYAVGLTETGRAGRLQPYSMNIDGRPAASDNLAEAMQRFEAARRDGAKMIDIGCMQINHHYHASHFASLAEMFDPGKNVDYAAHLLQELRMREGSWTLAVARYNAGPNNNPAQKRYVCGVIRNMVASGFGAWTDNARAFCQ